MKPEINIQQFEANLDILNNEDEINALIAFLKLEPQKLAEVLGFSSPLQLLRHVCAQMSKYADFDDSIFLEVVGNLSDAEKARFFNHYPVRSADVRDRALGHHDEAMNNGEYNSLIKQCNEASPQSVSAMARSEIYSLIAEMELQKLAQEYLAEHPEEYAQAYEYRGSAQGYKMCAISEAWRAVNSGKPEMLSQLLLHYRDLRFDDYVYGVFELMLRHRLDNDQIKIALQVVLHDDYISGIYYDLADMAKECGYAEVVDSVVYHP